MNTMEQALRKAGFVEGEIPEESQSPSIDGVDTRDLRVSLNKTLNMRNVQQFDVVGFEDDILEFAKRWRAVWP